MSVLVRIPVVAKKMKRGARSSYFVTALTHEQEGRLVAKAHNIDGAADIDPDEIFSGSESFATRDEVHQALPDSNPFDEKGPDHPEHGVAAYLFEPSFFILGEGGRVTQAKWRR